MKIAPDILKIYYTVKKKLNGFVHVYNTYTYTHVGI